MDDIRPIFGQNVNIGPSYSFRQSFVCFPILLNVGDDDEEVVLLRHAVDVGHAGLVHQLGVGLVAGPALRALQVTPLHWRQIFPPACRPRQSDSQDL